ncbi:MAG TPA: efflux RND transporter periplasmic adaptor subunit [Verrucomicrobiae bacterium]|nr:efflux RND transporter periplasmic adaptor subunit [Verrucomicrobiae bacterium]
MKRKVFIAVGVAIAIVVGAFLLLAAVKGGQIFSMINFAKTFVPPPETVSTAVAHEQQWNDTLTAVGSISAAQGVIVAPEIGGAVSEIDFESGATVKKGDLLLKLDTSSEEAQLRAAEAQVDWAKVNARRLRELRTNNTVSQSELDQAEASLKQAQANADNIQAIIDKKTIRAPFSGRLGIRQVNLGETLNVGQAIVSLQSLAPVYCDFSLPQQDFARLQTGLEVRVTSDAYQTNFTGTLTAINPDLDVATRNVKLQATFANAEQLLRPGMFVRVEVVLPDQKTVLAIPATAILSAAYGDSVFVVESSTNSPSGLAVRQQFIRTGRAHGDYVSVVSGLKAGDKVVSAGLFKLRNGVGISVNNEIAPPRSTTPKPSDS